MYAGSSRVGTFFKNAWNKIKSWYGNNAEKLKSITDILVNAGTNVANTFEEGGSLSHYVSCFREPDGTLSYQDIFGKLNEFPLSDTNHVFHVNKSEISVNLCQ